MQVDTPVSLDRTDLADLVAAPIVILAVLAGVLVYRLGGRSWLRDGE